MVDTLASRRPAATGSSARRRPRDASTEASISPNTRYAYLRGDPPP